MKKGKSLLSLFLALALALTAFSGCGSKSASSGAAASGDSAETQKVVMYLITFNNIPDDYSKVTDAINNYIAEKYPDAHVALDLRLIGPADYNDKIKLAMQSGTQMDLFIPLDLQTFIAQNMCMDISSYLDQYGQDMVSMIKKDFGTDGFSTLTQNGAIYGVPINKAVVINPTLSYNKEMLASVGVSIDDINSIWDLSDVYAKIKAKYPDVYCYAPTNQQDTYVSLILEGDDKMDRLGDTTYTGVVFGDSGKVVNLYETDQFRKYVDLMRSWYLAGYVPQDMATSTTTAPAYASSGRLFSTYASYSGVDKQSDNSVLNQLTGTDAYGSKWISSFYMDTMSTSLAMCVSSNSKVPEAAVKLLNIVYSDEFVLNTILFGIEGEDYVKPSDHVAQFPEGLDANTVPYTAYLCNGVIGSESLQWVTTSEEDYQKKLQAIEMNKSAERSPYYGFVFDASNVVNEMTALTNVVKQYYPGLVCGSLDPDEAIPEFVKALKDAGVDTVVAEKQKQLDAWIAANQ